MKYLALDYGSKKVGFAQSDDDGRIAFPLMISPNDASLLKDTVELIREMKCGVLVVGESVNEKGKPNAIFAEAKEFADKVKKSIDVHIVFEKEWMSTLTARSQPGKEGSHNVDDAAAAVILQRYLDKVNVGSRIDDEVAAPEDEEEDDNAGNNEW